MKKKFSRAEDCAEDCAEGEVIRNPYKFDFEIISYLHDTRDVRVSVQYQVPRSILFYTIQLVSIVNATIGY